MCDPIIYKYVNVETDTFLPATTLGSEKITMKCSGIFDSLNKLCSLKIGECERLVDLEYIDENTFTFVAPPLEWIKNTK